MEVQLICFLGNGISSHTQLVHVPVREHSDPWERFLSSGFLCYSWTTPHWES